MRALLVQYLAISALSCVSGRNIIPQTRMVIEEDVHNSANSRRRAKSSKSDGYMNRHQNNDPYVPIAHLIPTPAPTLGTASSSASSDGADIKTSHPTIEHPVTETRKKTKGSKSSRSHKLTRKPKGSKKLTLRPTPSPSDPTGPPVPTAPTVTQPPSPTAPTIIPPTPTQPTPPTVGTPTAPPTGEPGCMSSLSMELLSAVPEVVTRNPERCCSFDGPTAVFVTHAHKDEGFPSGFEVFWNQFYDEVEATASLAGLCFVMTGVDQDADTTQTLSEILSSVVTTVSERGDVPAFMITDPVDDLSLVERVRAITGSSLSPEVGIFNAGYDNIVIEAIITGGNRLPFVGPTTDSDYGSAAAQVSSDLLNGETPIPLCFNGRNGELSYIGERCSTFYEDLGVTAAPASGIPCSSTSSSDQILQQIIGAGANAVFTHVDCCAVVAEAVGRARNQGRNIIAGCQDIDTSDGGINYIVGASIPLQAYQASSWTFLPVLKELSGSDGVEQRFPGLQSLVNVDVQTQVLAL